MGRKKNVWTLRAINKRNLTPEGLEIAKKGKPYKRNRISSNSSTNNAIRTIYVKAKIDKT